MANVFFYDEINQCVSSISRYHEEECCVEALVESWPDVIYFYAKLEPEESKREEPEVECNTVVLRSNGGHIFHSYSAGCPEGCQGDLPGCLYQDEQFFKSVNDG